MVKIRRVRLSNKSRKGLYDRITAGGLTRYYKVKKAQTHKKVTSFFLERYKFVRHMLVKMYYAVEKKKNTPTPFAEFRAWTVSRANRSRGVTKELEKAIDRLQWIFQSMKTMKNIRGEIEGEEEDVGIDADEIRTSELTGINRYVAFYKPNGGAKAEYDEDAIRQIEYGRTESYKKWAKDKGIQRRLK